VVRLDPRHFPATPRKPMDKVDKCCWGKTKCHCPSGCPCKKTHGCKKCDCKK
jgi:hypothetical protein